MRHVIFPVFAMVKSNQDDEDKDKDDCNNNKNNKPKREGLGLSHVCLMSNGQIMKDTMPERKGFGVQHNSQTKSKGIFQQSETGNVVNPIVTPEKVKF